MSRLERLAEAVEIAAADLPQYSGAALAAVAGLLWAFGAGGLSLTYLLHFAFKVRVWAPCLRG